MKTLFIILVSFFTLIGQNQPAEREKFDPTKDPEKELEAAKLLAKKLKKNILLDVGGEWCKWCHAMDKFIAETAEVNELLKNNFIIVKINYSKENKNEAFLSKFPKVEGYPHLFVLNAKGKLLHSQNTGELEEGSGYSKEKYLLFLNKFLPTNTKKKKS